VPFPKRRSAKRAKPEVKVEARKKKTAPAARSAPVA
jgi:hypothetical protein